MSAKHYQTTELLHMRLWTSEDLLTPYTCWDGDLLLNNQNRFYLAKWCVNQISAYSVCVCLRGTVCVRIHAGWLIGEMWPYLNRTHFLVKEWIQKLFFMGDAHRLIPPFFWKEHPILFHFWVAEATLMRRPSIQSNLALHYHTREGLCLARAWDMHLEIWTLL